MRKVIYKGLADVRTLSGSDLKLDDFETTDFRRNEAVEVSDEAAKLLLGRPRVFGRFIEAPAEEAKATAEGNQTLEEAVDSPDSTSQLGVDSPAGATASGTTVGGSSTRRKTT